MKILRFITTIVLAHLIVAVAHGAAHQSLAINPPRGADVVFILLAVYLLPLVAIWRLRAAGSSAAAILLLVSMGGALIYGIVFHYGLPTPDHVSQVPHTPSGALFRVTAGLLAPLEAIGAALGLMAWRAARTVTFTGAASVP